MRVCVCACGEGGGKGMGWGGVDPDREQRPGKSQEQSTGLPAAGRTSASLRFSAGVSCRRGDAEVRGPRSEGRGRRAELRRSSLLHGGRLLALQCVLEEADELLVAPAAVELGSVEQGRPLRQVLHVGAGSAEE